MKKLFLISLVLSIQANLSANVFDYAVEPPIILNHNNEKICILRVQLKSDKSERYALCKALDDTSCPDAFTCYNSNNYRDILYAVRNNILTNISNFKCNQTNIAGTFICDIHGNTIYFNCKDNKDGFKYYEDLKNDCQVK